MLPRSDCCKGVGECQPGHLDHFDAKEPSSLRATVKNSDEHYHRCAMQLKPGVRRHGLLQWRLDLSHRHLCLKTRRWRTQHQRRRQQLPQQPKHPKLMHPLATGQILQVRLRLLVAALRCMVGLFGRMRLVYAHCMGQGTEATEASVASLRPASTNSDGEMTVRRCRRKHGSQ